MTKPYYAEDGVTLYLDEDAGCLAILPTLPDASVDAVVCDPPYELGFMGKAWDASGIAYNTEVWRQCWRVLKPGGHLVAFGGTRTYHRMTVAIEDAGFEIRDSLHWIYGSGFPKSLDVSKAIDKQRDDQADVKRVAAYLKDAADRAGMTARTIDAAFGFAGQMAGQWLTQRDWVLLPKWEQWLQLRDLLGFGEEMDAEVWRLNGRKGTPGEAWATASVIRTEDRFNEPSGIVQAGQGGRTAVTREIKAANSEEAARWQGWGTALKPAHEPIVLARKPLACTVAGNVLAHGTGAINIDGCRIATPDDTGRTRTTALGVMNDDGWQPKAQASDGHAAGRWPSNVILAHPPFVDEHGQPIGDACADGCIPGCPVAEMDRQSGVTTSQGGSRGQGGGRGAYSVIGAQPDVQPGFGDTGGASRFFTVFRYEAKAGSAERPRLADGTAHTTVKPLALIRWLVRLVTPPGGTVLDWCAGSGTTLEACVIEGFPVIGIELERPHAELCRVRLSKPIATALFGDFDPAA